MHEMSLAEGVLDLAEKSARENGASHITGIWLELGALAQIEVEALRFCFEAVTRGSMAENARLEIVATPGVAWCMPCGETVPLAALGDSCPRCGGYQLTVTGGDAMRVKEIEIA